jgi:hypothetical protein
MQELLNVTAAGTYRDHSALNGLEIATRFANSLQNLNYSRTRKLPGSYMYDINITLQSFTSCFYDIRFDVQIFLDIDSTSMRSQF